jgi:putative tryptophan/tyrosine transport system substrate-binding protein
MRRREFLTVAAAGAAATAWIAVLRAQAKTKLVGILLTSTESDPEMQARLAAFSDALAKLGWVDGKNLRIEPRWMGGDIDEAARNAVELVALKPDVMVANSTTGIDAALKASRNVPTVFVMVGNPVGSGYVTNLAHPGGNVTGFSAFDPEIAGKWVQVLKEIAPTVTQATILFQSGYEFLARVVPTVAPGLGLQVTSALCQTEADIERAIAAGSGINHALIVIPSPLFVAHRDLIIGAAARHRLPAIYPFRYFADAGGLMAYGIDTIDIFQRSASYVDRILKGEKPGDLPVQAPVKFQLVINLKTASALGLAVPPSLLARADEVIE